MPGKGKKTSNATGGARNKAKFSNGKKKSKVVGQGAYAMAGLAKSLASAVAQRMAKQIPKGTFEKKGAAAGRGLSRFTGFGDYVMNDIVHKQATVRQGVPQQTVSNCEYVKDIVAPGTNNFTLNKLLCNVSEGTFPWLQSIGKLYTKYRFKQLLFEFRTMSSDYSANVGLGSVILAPLYNILQDDFVTKQQMEAATHAVSFKPSNSCVCGIECAPQDNQVKWFNVRTSTQEVTPFTDPCKFFYAISGCPAAADTVLGELWVHYTVELIEPILTPASIGSTGVWGALRTISSTAGIVGTSFGGIATTPSVVINAVPASFNPQTISVNVGQPIGAYYVSVDSGEKRLWFYKPGLYQVTWNAAFTVAPTGTQTTLPFYEAAPGQGSPAITPMNMQALFTGSDKKIWACNWLINVSQLNSSVTFTMPSWMGGVSSIVLETQTCGSQLVVSRVGY